MPRQHQVSLYDRALQKQEKLGPLFSFLKNSAVKTSLSPTSPISSLLQALTPRLISDHCLPKKSVHQNTRSYFPFVFRATIALSARHLFCSPSHTADPRIPRIQTHAIAPLCLPYNNRALSRALTLPSLTYCLSKNSAHPSASLPSAQKSPSQPDTCTALPRIMLSQPPPHGKKAGQKAKVEIRKRFPLSYSSLSSV